METKIGNFTVTTVEGYDKPELPYYNEWLAALRSGEYKQTKGILVNTTENSYCCLGVLLKVQGRLSEHGTDDIYSCTKTLSTLNPCYITLEACGHLPAGAEVLDNLQGSIVHLAGLNDLGASFEDIANIIELLWKPKQSENSQ